MMRLRKRKPMSKEAKKDRMVYNLVILGTLVLLFGYSIAFCAVSTSLKFEGSGKVKSTVPDALPNGPYRYRNGYFYGEGNVMVATGGAYVTKLSDMTKVMKADSSGYYVIYMVTPYTVDSYESVNANYHGIYIYLDEFDNSGAVFKVSKDFKLADYGSFYITVSDSNTSFKLSERLFECGASLELGSVYIQDFTSSSNIISIGSGLLYLSSTNITSLTVAEDIIRFYGESSFEFCNVEILGNIITGYWCFTLYGLNNCTSKILRYKVDISFNYYSYKSVYEQHNVYITRSCVSEPIEVSSLNSSSDIRFFFSDTPVPSSSNPVTILKNVNRSNIVPRENVFSDISDYTVAYGDSNSTTTIVLK